MAIDRLVVLLVDDQRFVATAVTQLLASEADIQLLGCEDARTAVAMANRVAPAIILQDLLMPGIDGIALIHAFRDNPATARVPVVVLSGNDDVATRARVLAAGAAGYLVKLPAKADLIACIRRHARRQSSTSDPDVVSGAADAVNVPRSGDQPVLDPEVLDSYDAPADFLQDVIDEFIKDAAARVDTMLRAASRGSTHTAKATAHTLKGSSSAIGAMRLAELCDQMERCAASQPPAAQLAAIAGEIQKEFGRVCQALRARVDV